MKFAKLFHLSIIFVLFSCSYEIERPLPKCDLTVASVNVNKNNKELLAVTNEILGLNADVVMLSNFPTDMESYKPIFEEKDYEVKFLTKPFNNSTISLAFLVKEKFAIKDCYECPLAYLNGYPGQNGKIGILRLGVNSKVISLVTIDPVKYDGAVNELLDGISDGLLSYQYSDPSFSINKEQIIWGGTFNFSPASKMYKKFETAGMIDSHLKGAHKYNMTKNNSVRADYIFASKTITCEYAGTFSVTSSNHRGVVAGFNL